MLLAQESEAENRKAADDTRIWFEQHPCDEPLQIDQKQAVNKLRIWLKEKTGHGDAYAEIEQKRFENTTALRAAQKDAKETEELTQRLSEDLKKSEDQVALDEMIAYQDAETARSAAEEQRQLEQRQEAAKHQQAQRQLEQERQEEQRRNEQKQLEQRQEERQQAQRQLEQQQEEQRRVLQEQEARIREEQAQLEQRQEQLRQEEQMQQSQLQEAQRREEQQKLEIRQQELRQQEKNQMQQQQLLKQQQEAKSQLEQQWAAERQQDQQRLEQRDMDQRQDEEKRRQEQEQIYRQQQQASVEQVNQSTPCLFSRLYGQNMSQQQQSDLLNNLPQEAIQALQQATTHEQLDYIARQLSDHQQQVLKLVTSDPMQYHQSFKTSTWASQATDYSQASSFTATDDPQVAYIPQVSPFKVTDHTQASPFKATDISQLSPAKATDNHHATPFKATETPQISPSGATQTSPMSISPTYTTMTVPRAPIPRTNSEQQISIGVYRKLEALNTAFKNSLISLDIGNDWSDMMHAYLSQYRKIMKTAPLTAADQTLGGMVGEKRKSLDDDSRSLKRPRAANEAPTPTIRKTSDSPKEAASSAPLSESPIDKSQTSNLVQSIVEGPSSSQSTASTPQPKAADTPKAYPIPSIFGSKTAPSPSSVPATKAAGTPQASTFTFGSPSKAPVGSSTPAPKVLGNIFGSAKPNPTPSIFGSQNDTLPSSASEAKAAGTPLASPFTFGSPSKAPVGSSTPAPKVSDNIFGSAKPNPTPSIFGAKTDILAKSLVPKTDSAPSTFGFNSTAKTGNTPSLFGFNSTAKTDSAPGLFNFNSTAKPDSAPSLFGLSSTAKPDSAPSLFGFNSTAKSDNAPSTVSFNSTTKPDSVSSTFSFKSTAKPNGPISSFGGTASNGPTPSFGGTATSGPAPPSLFSGLNGSSNSASRATTPGTDAGTESGDGAEADSEMPALDQNDFTALTAEEIRSEDILCEVPAATLILFDRTEKKWETKGKGPLRVMKNKQSGVAHVLARIAPSGKVVLNSRIVKSVEYKKMKKGCVQYIDVKEGGKVDQWLVRTGKDDALADKLLDVLQKNQ